MSTSFKQGSTQDELQRILKLFLSHSHDPELHVRHIAALDNICKGGNGFPVQDLPIITDILGCTLDLVRSQHSHAFLEPACSLVRWECADITTRSAAAAKHPHPHPQCLLECCRAVGRPYIKQSSTDELRMVSAVTGLLQQVARVFTEQLPCQLQACTAQVRSALSSDHSAAHKPDRRWPPSVAARCRLWIQAAACLHSEGLSLRQFVSCRCWRTLHLSGATARLFLLSTVSQSQRWTYSRYKGPTTHTRRKHGHDLLLQRQHAWRMQSLHMHVHA